MQPTCVDLHVRSPTDAHVIFHAVSQQILRMVTRRLDTHERRAIRSGCVYVWEERVPSSDLPGNGGSGIERWTDSIFWGPSRVRDEFLYYRQKRPNVVDVDVNSDLDGIARMGSSYYRPTLIKQTYSAFVETAYGRRKWHLTAYYTEDTLDKLITIDDYPLLANLNVPFGKYTSARTRRPSGGFRPNYDCVPNARPMIKQHPFDPFQCQSLAPLEYLETLPPQRRHILDEIALMSFSVTLPNS